MLLPILAATFLFGMFWLALFAPHSGTRPHIRQVDTKFNTYELAEFCRYQMVLLAYFGQGYVAHNSFQHLADLMGH